MTDPSTSLQAQVPRPRQPTLAGWLLVCLVVALTIVELILPAPAGQPSSALEMRWQDDAWIVTRVFPASLAYDAGLRAGDRVLAHAGEQLTPDAPPPVLRGAPSNLTVARDGRLIQVETPARTPAGPWARLLYGLAGFLFVMVGILTWLRGGRGRVQTTFLVLCGAAGLVLVAMPAVQRDEVWGLVALFVLGNSALTALAIFARSFPYHRPVTVAGRRVVPEWLWLGVALLVAAYGGSFVDLIAYDVVRVAAYGWSIVALAATAVSIVQASLLARQLRDRQAISQLRITGGGVIAGFLPLLLVLVPVAFTGSYLIEPILVLPLTALLPLSVTYAMLRYRVMDVDLVVRRGVATVIAATVYLLALAGAHALLRQFPFALTGALGWLAALALIPLFNWLVRHFDRAVFGRGHDLHATLTATARALTESLDERRILDLVLERVGAALQPSLVTLYERDEAGGFRAIAWRHRHEPLNGGTRPPPLAPGDRLLARLLAGESWQAGGTLLRGDDSVLGDAPGTPALLVPAIMAEPTDAAWALGLAARPSALPYSREDIALVEALARTLASALANARHYGRLQAAYAALRQTQTQLVQSAKMAAIGEFASGITHELNQPLMVMRARVQQLMEMTGEPILSGLERIEAQTHKMGRVIDHMRAFSRLSLDDERDIPLNRVVDEALLLVGDQLGGHGITVEVCLAENLPPVRANPEQLEQVLINLLSNARDAVAGRPEQRVVVTTAIDADLDMVTLSVADTGPGIQPETLERVFEPFFTTKSIGHGTGLGLSISRDIIEHHRGRLEVESIPGIGTRFRVLLPARTRAATPAARDSAA